jgi:D-glucosaminate-6-phosphate ammonia-lyase
MSSKTGTDLFAQLGVNRVINAIGNVTVLGGSKLSPAVLDAMQATSSQFVEMEELLTKSGAAIADLMGAEAAFVTSGCYAALVLGAAGLMTGGDQDKVAKLPDTSGMRNEFLIQKPMRYHYDRCVSAAGGKLVEVGSTDSASATDLEKAINPQTAGIIYFARMDGEPGIVPLDHVIQISQRYGIGVLVDAASEIYPPERFLHWAQSGADLICFGAKYLGSANSTGILCGKRERVEAARLNNFLAYETHRNRAIGRGFKVDRQEIVATYVALRDWLEMDHEERLRLQEERIETISAQLAGLPNVRTERAWVRSQAWMELYGEVEGEEQGSAAAQALRAADPVIWVRPAGKGLYVAVHTLEEEEVDIVASRLREVLTQQSSNR